MLISVAEAAARLGKTPRQIRYLIKQGELRASRPGKAWRIERASLDAVAPGLAQTHARTADRIEREVAKVAPESPNETRRRYSLTDMKAWQLGRPEYARCLAELGPEHDATALLRESLDHLARGCHRFEREAKAAAYEQARDTASRAICALYLHDTPPAREIARALEQELMAAFAGLLRRLHRRR